MYLFLVSMIVASLEGNIPEYPVVVSIATGFDEDTVILDLLRMCVIHCIILLLYFFLQYGKVNKFIDMDLFFILKNKRIFSTKHIFTF